MLLTHNHDIVCYSLRRVSFYFLLFQAISQLQNCLRPFLTICEVLNEWTMSDIQLTTQIEEVSQQLYRSRLDLIQKMNDSKVSICVHLYILT